VRPLRISLRSILYYWRSNTAIILACAAAVAVIAGSLLVGSSVKASLTSRALERLGTMNHVIMARGLFFREALAHEMSTGSKGLFIPAVYMQGTVEDPETGIVIPKVNVIGVEDTFWDLYPGYGKKELKGRKAVLNKLLADDLGISESTPILLNIPRYGAVSRGSLFGRRRREEIMTSMRLTAGAVIPDSGPGLFTLSNDMIQPRTLFVSLAWFQKRVKKKNKANVILVSSKETLDVLNKKLADTATMEDFGFKTVVNKEKGYIYIQSRSLTLSEPAVQAAREAGKKNGLAVSNTSIYLFNEMKKGDKAVPYSTVAGFESYDAAPFPDLPIVKGSSDLKDVHDIILNTWTADDLAAEAGDSITVTYYKPVKMGNLETGTQTFRIKGITALEGSARDPKLVPEFEGITDSDTISEWDSPFDIDMNKIRQKDEDYWDEYKATPKAFISIETAKELWGGTDNDKSYITSVRFMPSKPADLEKLAKDLEKDFQELFEPGSGGVYITNTREQALQAGQGSADYSMLFISMSMFLIVSVLGLIGLLFRLLVERRMKQNGILLATGSSPRAVTAILLFEGAVMAFVGGVLGIPLGILYTDLMLNGIKKWGVGSLIPIRFEVYTDPVSIIIGVCVGVMAAVASMLFSIRKAGTVPVNSLLTGQRSLDVAGTDKKKRGKIFIALLGIIAVLCIGAGVLGLVSYIVVFFICGALLLTGGILFAGRLITGQPGFSYSGFSFRFRADLLFRCRQTFLCFMT
jgi:ABC-type lipoprotein release transport system permease subunit